MMAVRIANSELLFTQLMCSQTNLLLTFNYGHIISPPVAIFTYVTTQYFRTKKKKNRAKSGMLYQV